MFVSPAKISPPGMAQPISVGSTGVAGHAGAPANVVTVQLSVTPPILIVAVRPVL